MYLYSNYLSNNSAMEYKIEYNSDKQFLWVTVTGDWNIEQSRQGWTTILEKAEGQQCLKVLVDDRKMDFRKGIMFLHTRAEEFTSQGICKQFTKLAVVYPSSRKIDAEFFTTTARNKGLNLRCFESIDKAIEWLTG
jgi:hypothetical protein